MNIAIKKNQKNILLLRHDIQARIAFEGKTPSRPDVSKALAEHLKANSEALVVKSIVTRFGERSADVAACLYDSKEAKEKFEPKIKVKEKKQDGNKGAESGKKGQK